MVDRTAVITGCSGFLGSRIAASFLNVGWRVRGLVRRASPALAPSIERYDYDLGHEPSEAAFDGVDVLIHCAHATSRDGTETWRLNVDGSEKLFASARSAGVSRIIYVSSLAASPEAHSNYGREKYAVESMLLPGIDVCVRPGLIVGNGSLYGSMSRVIKVFRAAPIFGGGSQPVYLVSEADLCEGIRRLAEEGATGRFVFAAQHSITLSDLYRLVAISMGTTVACIHLPYGPALFLVSAFESIGMRLPVSAESLRGLQNMREIVVPHYEGFDFGEPSEIVMGAKI